MRDRIEDILPSSFFALACAWRQEWVAVKSAPAPHGASIAPRALSAGRGAGPGAHHAHELREVGLVLLLVADLGGPRLPARPRTAGGQRSACAPAGGGAAAVDLNASSASFSSAFRLRNENAKSTNHFTAGRGHASGGVPRAAGMHRAAASRRSFSFCPSHSIFPRGRLGACQGAGRALRIGRALHEAEPGRAARRPARGARGSAARKGLKGRGAHLVFVQRLPPHIKSNQIGPEQTEPPHSGAGAAAGAGARAGAPWGGRTCCRERAAQRPPAPPGLGA